MINVGLNGFVRIGRAITRIMTQSSDFNLKVVNDLEPDVSNLAYLLKYDSIYGKNQVPIEVKEKNLKLGRNDIQFCAEEKITDVPWRKFDLDLISSKILWAFRNYSSVRNKMKLNHFLISRDRVYKNYIKFIKN